MEQLLTLAVRELTGFVVLVNPHMARQWLEANSRNRALRRNHVRILAREITEVRWRPTHQGIAFAESGRLIDGQHRLWAIIEANKPALLTVFVGLGDDMFGALDRGQRRTISDELLEDKRYVGPCTWLLDRMRSPSAWNPGTAPAEAQQVLAIYKTLLDPIIAATPGRVKRGANASVKSALMVRLMAAPDSARKLLLEQYEALVRTRPENMDQTTGALLRRLELVKTTGAAAATEIGSAAWIAFNPEVRDRENIVVREGTIIELCQVAAAQIANHLPADKMTAGLAQMIMRPAASLRHQRSLVWPE